MLHRDCNEVLARERHVAGEQLVEDDAERVDVGLLVDALALRLLGRDVVRRAENRPGLGQPALHLERAGDAEVGHLRLAVAVQKHVLRLHVAVHEAVLVRERQAPRDLDRERERPIDRQRPVGRDQTLEGLAADVLEDDELALIVLAAVDHRHDVGVREHRRRARFAAEALDVLRVLLVVVVQHLQRDRAVEKPVVRPVDARHRAGADELFELVAVREHLPDHPQRLDAYWGACGDASGQADWTRRAQPVAAATGKPDGAEPRRARRTIRMCP